QQPPFRYAELARIGRILQAIQMPLRESVEPLQHWDLVEIRDARQIAIVGAGSAARRLIVALMAIVLRHVGGRHRHGLLRLGLLRSRLWRLLLWPLLLRRPIPGGLWRRSLRLLTVR